MKPQAEMEPVKKYRIFLAGVSANMASFVLGTSVGWTSPVIPKLRDHTNGESPLDEDITKSDEGWISSIITLTALGAALISGPIGSKIGRKRNLLLSSVIFAISYIILMVGTKIWCMYVARMLQGFGGGFVITTLPMYGGEIATDDCRGAVGTLMTLFMCGGILYCYVIGPYVTYMTLQWCCLATAIAFFATFIFMPETPYFFAMKGRKADAIKSLQFLRGQSADAVEPEMMQIQNCVDECMLQKGTILDLFRSRSCRRALLICCGLLALTQFSGTTAVTFNSQSIFTSAKTTLDPAISTIILGLVQLLSNLATPFVIERMGRRVILVISALGMCLSLFALGAFFYVQTFSDASDILWLPVPALVLFNIMYAFGFGPVPWAIMSEMFPSNVKSIATSIASCVSWLVGFLVTRWFPELNELGPYIAFWIFGSFCFCAILFVIFVVIETKGMSLERIQEKLNE